MVEKVQKTAEQKRKRKRTVREGEWKKGTSKEAMQGGGGRKIEKRKGRRKGREEHENDGGKRWKGDESEGKPRKRRGIKGGGREEKSRGRVGGRVRPREVWRGEKGETRREKVVRFYFGRDLS